MYLFKVMCVNVFARSFFCIIKSLITVIVFILPIPFAIYFYSMIIYPLKVGDWAYAQSVWYRWQGLNVGVLALFSSVFIYMASRYSSEEKRKREFSASKAFLNEALSELIEYFEKSAQLYEMAWHKEAYTFDINFPSKYRVVVKECIIHADPLIGDNLIKLLIELQVHDAKIRHVQEKSKEASIVNSDLLIDGFYSTGMLMIMAYRLLDFSRGEKESPKISFQWEDFEKIYSILGVDTIAISSVYQGTLKNYTINKVNEL